MKLLACVLILFSCGLAAQQAPTTAAAPAAGQVSGRVFCADTGQPARFASVQLVSEHPDANPALDASAMGKNPDFEKVLAKAMTAMMKGNNVSTVSGLDGSFTLDKVPPGTYYVLAQLAGYQSPLSQFSMMERMKADAATMKAVESLAEKIVVQPGQQAHVEVRLERGASISGVVRYDDGSPAPGVTAVLMVEDKDGKWKELGAAGTLPSMTDDRGRYRIFGMNAGKYAVKAALPTTQATTGLGANVSLHMNMGDALVVYSGGAMREKDIKPIEVGTGDDVDGVDVIFPLDNLHAVSGSVVAKSDNHAVDAGSIVLEDADGKTALRTASIEADGTFHLNYVPEGQYVVKAEGASDTDSAGSSDGGNDLMRLMRTKVLKSYGEADLPVTVKADVTGLSLQVPEQSSAPKASPFPNGVPTIVAPPPPSPAPGTP
jgi:hypothetical protein